MSANDKTRHHIVTGISLAGVLLIYFAAHRGWLGETMEHYASAYLVGMLIFFGLRALLTELGVRR